MEWEREKYTAIAVILGVLLSVGAIFYFRGEIPFAIIEPPTPFNITVYFYSNTGLDVQVGSLAGLLYKGTSNYVTCPYQTDCSGYCCDGDGIALIDLRGVPDGEYDLYLSKERVDRFYSTRFPITISQDKSVHVDWYFLEDKICIDSICPIQPPPEEQIDALIRMLIQQIIQQTCESNPYICSLIVIKEGKYPINPCLGDYSRLNVSKILDLDIYRALYISNPDYAKIEAGAEPIYDYGNIYSTYYVPLCMYMDDKLQCWSMSRQGYTENWTSKWWCISNRLKNCYMSGETFNYDDTITCCINLQTLILNGNPPSCEGCTMLECIDKLRICSIGVCGNNICEGYENQCNCQSDCGG